MKKCPFCAEQVQDEAIKCKHCGEMVGARLEQRREQKPARGRSFRIGVATVFVICAVVAVYVAVRQSGPTQMVRRFLDAAMANRVGDARALCERDCWVLDYDVLGYTVKNRYEDIVSVEVSFRGWEAGGEMVKKGQTIREGHNNSADWHVVSNGMVRRVLRFQVQNGKIAGVQ